MRHPRLVRSAGLVAATALVFGAAAAGTVAATPHTIILPGAHSAEGVATGAGSTFYAGELFTGDIFRGDLESGAVTRWIDAPDGRMATGIRVDEATGLLFVAGAATGQGYVYDLATGAPIASYQFGAPGSSFINDVAVARGVAWFTDSAQPRLYAVPITGRGTVGDSWTLELSGPAANLSGAFNLNGIAASPDGGTLIVAHSADATIYTVDPTTGASAAIAGANLPNVDGILFEAGRLWAVQNQLNQIAELRLSSDLSSATLVQVITDDAFGVPTTVGRWGSHLAAVNAHFDTGFPPTAPTYEVVIVER